MNRKSQPSRVDVRADYERRVALAEKTIADGPVLEALHATLTSAETALRQHAEKHYAGQGMGFPGMAPPQQPTAETNAEKQRLEEAVTAARTAIGAREAEIARAQKDLALRPMLAAHATAKEIAAEMQALAADGDNAVKRLAAVDGMIAADEEAIRTLTHRQQAAIDEAAEAAVAARLEGKPAPVTSAPVAADLAEREAAVAAARRLRTKLAEQVTAATARTDELQRRWLIARQLASQLDLAQWLAENATFINTHMAIQRAAGRYGTEIDLSPNEIEVERMAKAIRAECAPWRPSIAQAVAPQLPPQSEVDEHREAVGA